MDDYFSAAFHEADASETAKVVKSNPRLNTSVGSAASDLVGRE